MPTQAINSKPNEIAEDNSKKVDDSSSPGHESREISGTNKKVAPLHFKDKKEFLRFIFRLLFMQRLFLLITRNEAC